MRAWKPGPKPETLNPRMQGAEEQGETRGTASAAQGPACPYTEGQ
jgi:hypothetical protein